MTKPHYMKGKRSIKLHLHSVFDVLHDIHEQGHAPQFKAAAEKAGIVLSAEPKTVNFVKDYLADNGLHETSEVAANVVGGCLPERPPTSVPTAPPEPAQFGLNCPKLRRSSGWHRHRVRRS